jgi:diaminohydroxyphosphoribosylaminopyrimidine deaminase/5-amino-6-(5-phosphoribosylamino)uracil reductase
VVLDPMLRLPLESRLVRSARATPLWIVTGAGAPADRESALRGHGIDVLRVEGTGRPHLSATLQLLAARGITRLMVEAGPVLAGAFVAADLVDEAVLFRAPLQLGPDALDALQALPLTTLTQSGSLTPLAVEQIGQDTAETFERA